MSIVPNNNICMLLYMEQHEFAKAAGLPAKYKAVTWFI